MNSSHKVIIMVSFALCALLASGVILWRVRQVELSNVYATLDNKNWFKSVSTEEESWQYSYAYKLSLWLSGEGIRGHHSTKPVYVQHQQMPLPHIYAELKRCYDGDYATVNIIEAVRWSDKKNLRTRLMWSIRKSTPYHVHYQISALVSQHNTDAMNLVILLTEDLEVIHAALIAPGKGGANTIDVTEKFKNCTWR